jgi:hypothetical protein
MFKHGTKYLDKIPTREELKLILDVAPSLSTKIAIELMAYASLRPEDISIIRLLKQYFKLRMEREEKMDYNSPILREAVFQSIYIIFIKEKT